MDLTSCYPLKYKCTLSWSREDQGSGKVGGAFDRGDFFCFSSYTEAISCFSSNIEAGGRRKGEHNMEDKLSSLSLKLQLGGGEGICWLFFFQTLEGTGS